MDNCNKCGGPKVLNPHTGKMFCKDKCWLKGADSTGSYPSPKPQGNEEVLDALRKIFAKLLEIENKIQ